MELANKNYYYLKFIFFLRYFADAMFYSFTALYLTSVGLKEGIIGNIASITTITCLVVNPIWSIIAKNNRISRILLLVLSILEGTIIILYGNINVVSALMVFTCLMAIAAGPYYNLLDGYAVGFCELHHKEYSKLRVMGSIAYVVGTPLSGVLIDWIGYGLVFGISGILFILTGILTVFLKRITLQDGNGQEKRRDFKKILKNKWFIVYVIAYILIVIVSGLGDNYISLLFTKVKGLSTSAYSFVSCGILLCEVLTIFVLGKAFSKANPVKLMLFSGLVFFLRSFIVSFTDLPLWVLIPAACLRGIGWGTFLFFHLKYVLKQVGVENVTTAVILLSVCSSLVQFLMNNSIGYIIEATGYGFTYRLLASIILVSTLGYYFIMQIKQKKSRINYENN